MFFLGFGTLLGLFFTAQTYVLYAYAGSPVKWVQAAMMALGEWYLWVAFAPFIIWLSRRFPVDPLRWKRNIFFHIPTSLLVAILHPYLYSILAWVLLPRGTFPIMSFFREMLRFQFPTALMTYWAIVAATSALDFYHRYRDRQLNATLLEKQLVQAQYDTLKSQLQPHFLFNTLHSISTLMHRDVVAADHMLVRLSDLLRIVTKHSQVQEVPLKEELDFLNRYLEIEKIRFHHRLTVELEIDPCVLDALVPHVILQPFVENSIHHGIVEQSSECRVVINAKSLGGMLHITVADNGAGMAPRNLGDRLNGGLGIANAQARLVRLYGTDQIFEICDNPGGGVVVRIAIPFHLAGQLRPARESVHYEHTNPHRR